VKREKLDRLKQSNSMVFQVQLLGYLLLQVNGNTIKAGKKERRLASAQGYTDPIRKKCSEKVVLELFASISLYTSSYCKV
jgi:hypothetical protein